MPIEGSEPAKVDLRKVVDALELPDSFITLVHRATGELAEIWSGEDLEPGDEELLESEDWLALPDSFQINEGAVMREFARQLDDADLGAFLLEAFSRRGAFRRFKDRLIDAERIDDWYAFRTRAFEQLARDWLVAHDFEPV